MLNKVILIGNVGMPPEIRTTSNGNEVATIRLATSERWKDKQTGENKERTEWHNVVIFKEALVKLVANYVVKGSKLYIEGSIQTRKWEDDGGTTRYSTEIVLQGFDCNFKLLDPKPVNKHSQDKGNGFVSSEVDDEIPF